MRTAITSKPTYPVEDYEADLTDVKKDYLNKMNPPKRHLFRSAMFLFVAGAGMLCAAAG